MTMNDRWGRLLALLTACCLVLASPEALAAEEGVTIGTGISAHPTAEVRVQWDDAWFAADADVYQHELAVTAMALSAAAYVRTVAGVSVQRALESFGFEHVKSCNYQFSAQSRDRTAYTFAVKTVKDGDGGPVRLVAIVIRGTGVYTEWAGNLDVGSGGEHAGFAKARDELLDSLERWLPEAGVAGRTKFLVTGHSRGGAAANLTAAYLVDAGLAEKRDVYGYTFAAPAVSTEAETEGYENIFNTVSGDDLVTRVPLESWGYRRYGVDRPLQSGEDGASAAMMERYAALTGQDYAFYQDADTVDRLTGTLRELAPTVSGTNMAMLSALLRGDLEGLQTLVAGNPIAALLMGRTAIRASSELTPLLQQEQAALVSAHCMAGYLSWLAAGVQE